MCSNNNEFNIIISCCNCDSEFSRNKKYHERNIERGYKNTFCGNKCKNEFYRKIKLEEISKQQKQKCTICKLEKRWIDFNKNKKELSGFNNICRECSNKKSKLYYEKNKDKHIKNVGQRNKKIRKDSQNNIIEILRESNCVDCGESDLRVLQFDHKNPDDKEYNVSKMLSKKYHWDNIKREIEKCEVRCANCHFKRTAIQFNWYKNIY